MPTSVFGREFQVPMGVYLGEYGTCICGQIANGETAIYILPLGAHRGGPVVPNVTETSATS